MMNDGAGGNNPAQATGGAMAAEQSLTFGQKAVGLTFNPSGDPTVHACKQAFANLIDMMAEMLTDTETSPEKRRLANQAITEAQIAQMWAVKALTWRD